jgi:hypothetical protein
MSRGAREDNLSPPGQDGLTNGEIDELEALIAGTEAPPEPVSGGFAATYIEAPPEAAQAQPVPAGPDAEAGEPTGAIPVPPLRPQPPASALDGTRAGARRLPLKRELIQQIEALRDKCPDVDIGTANRLRATNKADLARLLDELEVRAGVKPPPAPP